MSSITQCPACGTLFRVVTDQLKISEGWVRCGKCREVFDAQAHMSTTNTVLAGSDRPSTIIGLATGKKTVGAGQPVKKKKQDFSSSDWINSVNPPEPDEDSLSSGYNPISLMPQDFTDEELSSSDLAPLFAHSSTLQSADSTPTFVRQAQRAERWQSPKARAGLALIALLLLIGLTLQVVVQESSRIATAHPSTLPLLQALCPVAGCTIGPLKHIESVLVDASGFSKVRTEGKYEFYKISLNLKNSGTLAVAVPHIELSLNDSQDQPVLRRVLTASNLGLSQLTIAPTAELAGGATIQIDNTLLAGARVAGYRMLAFYP